MTLESAQETAERMEEMAKEGIRDLTAKVVKPAASDVVLFGSGEREELNRKHSEHPEVGDYWDEMFSPIARVLMVGDGLVCFQKLAGYAGRTATLTDPKPHVMSCLAFKNWLRYDSIPDKTWADVSPRKFAKAGG